MGARPASTPSPPPELLEETFQLLRGVMMGARRRFHDYVGAHGLTFPQWLLLRLLRRKGRMTARELADALEVTPANITGLVDRLERDGLATRSRSNEDRRVVYVRLTEAGHEKVEAIRGATAAVLGDMFDELSAQDMAQLRAILEKVKLAPEDDEC